MTTNKFESIESIVDFLREPFATATVVDEVVPKKSSKPKKTTRKTKTMENFSPQSTESDELIQRLPKGRVRYGPITVNPRKEPSKTLFTGRRSKNEVLSPDEEERRRDRRERNRVAATKCREKRETVLHKLEEEFNEEEAKYRELNRQIEELQTLKNDLESELNQHSDACFHLTNLTNEFQPATRTTMIFGNSTFLSSIPEDRIPSMPLNDPIVTFSEEEEQNTPPVDPQYLLTNSAYANEDFNSQWRNHEDMIIAFTTSSLERLMISIRTPTQSMEINNNTNGNNNSDSANLVNSNQTATCAKQSGFSEDESVVTSTIGNRFIC